MRPITLPMPGVGFAVTGGNGVEEMAHKRPNARTSQDVLQAVREAIELGWSYTDIQRATGASTGVIADTKREMGLLHKPSLTKGRSKRWPSTPLPVVAAARDMVITGQTYQAIREATGAPNSTIRNLRLELGVDAPRTQISNDLMAALCEAIRMRMTYADIKSQFSVSSAIIADVKREMGLLSPILEPQPPQAPPAPTSPAQAEDTTQDAPPTPLDPGAYFLAFRDGILEGHAREQALEEHVATLQSRINDLEAKNRELYDKLTQVRGQMSSWAGPAPIPNRNLSTGG